MHHPQRLNNTPCQKRTNQVGSSKALAGEEGCTSNYSAMYNSSGNKSLSNVLVEEEGFDSNLSSMYNHTGKKSYIYGRIGSGKSKNNYASSSTSSHFRESSTDDALNCNLQSSVSPTYHSRPTLIKSSNVSGSAMDLDVGGNFDNLMNPQHVCSSSGSLMQATISSSRKKSVDKDSRKHKSREGSISNGKVPSVPQPITRDECLNRNFVSDQSRFHDGSLDEVSQTQTIMRRGSSSKAPHVDDVTTSLYVEKRYRQNKNEIYSAEGEKSSNEKKPPLPKHYSVTNSPRRLGQSASAVTNDQLGKKKVPYNSHRLPRTDNLGQWTKDNFGGSGLCALSNLACSSAGDVMPSASSSSFNDIPSSEADVLLSTSSSIVGAGDCHRRPQRPFGFSNQGQTSRVVQHGKGSIEHGRRSDMEQSSSTRSGLSQQQHICPNLKPSRSGSSPRLLQMGPGYPQNTVPSDFPLAAPFSDRGSTPNYVMNDDRFQYLPRANNLFLDEASSFREQNQGSYGRTFCGNQPDLPREESMILNRNRPTSTTSAMSRMHETLYMRSSFSGPPPARPPPPPPSHFEVFSESSAPVPWLATQDSYLPQIMGSATLHSEANGQGSADVESMNFRSSRSHGELRPRISADSLSEILSALQAIERDEDLSYEQILMLEATILLGGTGLSDRYRDMRIDIDNMSYEELLALEERIGNVNTGLSEESARKCLRIVAYVPPANDFNCAPQDIEIKCSICQEEFQESVELGVLQCGHSHHIDCIKQWLSQKNQCPICKASASASA